MAQVLRERQWDILASWESEVRKLPAAQRLDPVKACHGMAELLEEIERAVEPAATEVVVEPVAQSHAVDRLADGFDLEQLLEEFTLLRDSILGVVVASGVVPGPAARRTLDHAIGRAAAACLQHYTRECERIHGTVSELERASLEALLQTAPDGLGLVDAELRYVRVNPALAAMNHRSIEEHVGRKILEVLPGGTGEFVSNCVRTALETGRPQVVELSDEALQIPSGAHYFRTSYFPVLGQEGAPTGVGAVVVDITTERRAVQGAQFFAGASNLLSSSLDLDTTLDSLARLVVRHMADGCVVHVPGRDGRVHRFSAGRDPESEELLRAQLALVPAYASIPPVRRVLETGQPELIAEVTPAQVEAASLNPAHRASLERFRSSSAMFVPLRARNRALGVLSILSRHPDHHYGSEDLQLAQELADRAGLAVDNAHLFEEAQRAARLRENVLAVVSHDLKNPLGTIMFNISGLRSEPPQKDDAKRLHFLDVAERSCRRMLRLISDLLDVGSIQAGRLAIERRPHDIDALLREAVELNAALAGEKNVRLERSPETTGGEAWCDRGRILQVLANLVGNAIKFSGAGASITLRAHRIADEVICSVSDTGPGIRDEDLPHLFEPYWSGGGAHTRGTGLGLSICKGIVEAHGGRLWVQSRVGAGSTFTMAIPASAPHRS